MHPPTRRAPTRLQIPIGHLTNSGQPCLIDLTQPGTHGLVVGTSGSGRTHLLRSIVTTATDIYSAAELNVVAVDFAGDRTFADLHDNTDRALTVIRRVQPGDDLVHMFTLAVRAEVAWRSQLLREAGGHIGRPIPDIATYNAMCDSGESLAPLPAQLVVVANYTHASPAIFTRALDDALASGRRTGMNFLFAASTPGDASPHVPHLSYRIALRTATFQDSRDVLGVSDAAELPETPGLGYLRVGEDLMSFRTAPPASAAVI